MLPKTKTIFITIFHGHLARNILRTKVLSLLARQANLEIVIIAPDFKKEYYQKEFGQSNVVIEGLSVFRPTRLDSFFRSLYYYFVDTQTVKIVQQEQFFLTGRYVKYFVVRLLTLIFGNLAFLRRLVRFFDSHLVGLNKEVELLFERYQPTLVVASQVMADQDVMFLRSAKSRHIRSIGMVRSWDNITVNKGNVRVHPDNYLAQNELMKNELVKYTEANIENIKVTGLTHFDYYADEKSRIPRTDFAKSIGADPEKRYIYFMPIGLSDEGQDERMIMFLSKILAKHDELKNYELLVSLHPNTEKTFCTDKIPGVVFINTSHCLISFSDGKITDREISNQAMEIMASSIYHSDLVINYQGTSSIDAAAFDKPVINIDFDEIKKPYLNSIRRYYDFEHYQPILKSKGVRLAHNFEQLEELILLYIKDPSLDREYRARMVYEQGFYSDGKSCEQTVLAILKNIE
ncbi:MAG: hypothetical protein WCW56_01855 [Candidatus Paceibacterota bacterium]|jgi:hypothetical protein